MPSTLYAYGSPLSYTNAFYIRRVVLSMRVPLLGVV